MTTATFLLCAMVLGGLQSKDASSVAGHWRAVDLPIRMHFQIDGTKLSGTVTRGGAAAMPIADGKIEQDAISFSLADDKGGMIAFSGRRSGDSIKFAVEGRKFPKTFTAVRAQ